jgi:hypothetical protein
MTITKWYRFEDYMISIDTGEISILYIGDEKERKTTRIGFKELIALKKLIDEAYNRAVKEKLCPICRNLGKRCLECKETEHNLFDPIKPEEIELG